MTIQRGLIQQWVDMLKSGRYVSEPRRPDGRMCILDVVLAEARPAAAHSKINNDSEISQPSHPSATAEDQMK